MQPAKLILRAHQRRSHTNPANIPYIPLPNAIVDAAGSASTSNSSITSHSTTSAKSTSAASGATTGPLPEKVVQVFSLTLLFVLLFLFLTTVPRLVARLQQPGAWRTGWLLKPRDTAVARAREAIRRSLHFGKGSGPILGGVPLGRKPTIRKGLLDGSDDGHGDLIQRINVRRGPALQPTHIPGWSTLVYPVSSAFGTMVPGTTLSVGQGFVYCLYAMAFLFVAFIKTSGADNLKRAGWLVVGQLPLMTMLGTKNSIVAFLVGRSYDKVNYIHRWIGRLLFVSALFHVIGFVVLWLQKNDAAQESHMHTSAWAALSGFTMMALFSLPIFRRAAHGIFLGMHWAGYAIFLIAICFHVSNGIYYALASFLLLGLDHVVRIVKTTYITATITAVPQMRTTRIEIPQLSRGWRAGQHVRIRVLSTKMGITSWTEAHPFTIASVASSEGGNGSPSQGVVLYVKAVGDWTNKLYEIAKEGSAPAFPKTSLQQDIEDPFSSEGEKSYYDDDEKFVYGSEKGDLSLNTHAHAHFTRDKETGRVVPAGYGSGTSMRMLVEGPYGGPSSYAMFSSYTSAFIVIGGSGISYGLAVLGELLRDLEAAKSRTRLIHLVWVIHDPASLIPLAEQFAEMQSRISYMPTVALKISVHYTRATPQTVTSSHVTLLPGRPDVDAQLDLFIRQTDSLSRGRGGLSGVAVVVCGPQGLMETVVDAEKAIGKNVRASVGGVETFRETFGM